MKRLLEKYKANYRSEEMHFEFQDFEINFDILKDFIKWKYSAFEDGKEKIIIFYIED
jgi:hypothetical protein